LCHEKYDVWHNFKYKCRITEFLSLYNDGYVRDISSTNWQIGNTYRFNIIQLLTFAEVDTMIYQPEVDYISRGRWPR